MILILDPPGNGHAFPRQWHVRRRVGGYLFMLMFFSLYDAIHGWMAGRMDGKFHFIHDVLYYMWWQFNFREKTWDKVCVVENILWNTIGNLRNMLRTSLKSCEKTWKILGTCWKPCPQVVQFFIFVFITNWGRDIEQSCIFVSISTRFWHAWYLVTKVLRILDMILCCNIIDI
jgi:hypothetical protein